MLWLLYVALLCFTLIQAVLFAQEPRLETVDGNLLIIGAQDKNVTLVASGRGAVNINGVDVLEVVNAAAASVSAGRTRAIAVRLLQADVRALQQDGLELKRTMTILYGMMGNVTAETSPGTSTTWRFSDLQALTTKVKKIEQNLLKNECASSPCRHGGTCIDQYLGFRCLCPDGWEGRRCKRDVNECLNLAGTGLGCQNGATCVNVPGSFTCQCPPGFFGKDCAVRANNCSSASSREMCDHGICVPDGTGHQCICDQGWTKLPGQQMCSVDVDECVTAPCSRVPKVNCINVPGTFRCESCPPGYTGNGHSCDDVNECAVSNGGCSVTPLVACRNTFGSFRCGPCPPGYRGDGVTCNYVGRCRDSDNGGCHFQAVCQELGSSVRCTCAAGFAGTGYGPNGCVPSALAPVNDHPCSPNPCVNGRCVLTSQYNYTCQCFVGFSGARCEKPSNSCDGVECLNGGTCVVTADSFRCLCTKFYTGRYCRRERSVCGGQLAMDSGTLEFPSASVRYKSNQNCAWWITVNASLVIQAVFDEFDLEPPKKAECTSDWLQIYDGKEIGSNPMMGKFCGSEKPLNGTLTTTGNNLFLWFKSDSSSNHMGFKLRWNTTQPVCGGDIDGTVHGVLASPGAPGKYPAGRDCHWTINSNVNQRISFTFFSLNIEQHENCDFDYLAFYDGDSTDSPEIARYCTTGTPPPLLSYGPLVHIHFHSDAISSDKGFQISHNPVPGIEGCGGVLTDTRGEIRSVMLDGKYRNRLDCVWIVRARPQQTVRLTFRSFYLEESLSCLLDYLEVRHGSDSGAPLAGKYCGRTVPEPITSQGSNLYIRFRTDVSLGHDGFVLVYEQLCDQKFTALSGVIKSPLYPRPYPNLINCIYLIDLPPGKAVQLDFLDFEVEKGPLSARRCYMDYLEIRDGMEENSPSLGQYCGADRPNNIVATHNKLWMKFHTDPSVQARGWVANYSAIDITCGGIYEELSGVIRSPRDGGLYPHNTECNWVIRVPPGFAIHLTFNTFHIESSHSECNFDYLAVSDGHQVVRGYPTRTYVPTKAVRFCGDKIPPPLHSVGNIVYLKFASDVSISYGGFEISYVARDESTVCGGNYIAPSGFIKTPGYPGRYPTSRTCTWTIKVANGQQIRLKTESFELEDSTDCNMDYVEIRNGIGVHSPLIGRYCGDRKPPTITSFANVISITFYSDTAVAYKGFKMTWDSSLSGCGGLLTAASGSITSPNYPEPYGKNAVCVYRLRIAQGNRIELIFVDLQLEDTNNCRDDYIEVYEKGKSLGRRCTSTQVDSLTSTSNELQLKFVSDFAITDKGFFLTYRTKCNVTITGERGVIESPGFPNDILAMTNCSWKIAAELGHTINISFSEASFANMDCKASYVEVAESEEDGAPSRVIGRYCQDKAPPQLIASTQMVVSITLVTDVANQRFRVEWMSVGCGGTMTRPSGNFTSPGYPAPYHRSVRCVWHIKVDQGQGVRLVLRDIGLETSYECSTDGLAIYGGEDETAPMLTTLCPHQLDEYAVESSSNAFTLVFWADSSFGGRGFTASYSSQPARCGGRLRGNHGVIHSHNYPKNYDDFDDCSWFITVLPNHRVNFTLYDFDLPWELNCSRNYLEIFDGIGTNGTSLAKLCGNQMPNVSSILATSNTMTVRMRTEETAKGFLGNYTMVCGGVVLVDKPGLLSLHYDYSDYSFEPNCSWTLIAPNTDGHVTLTPRITDNPLYRSCEDAKIEIFDGDSRNSSRIAEICGGDATINSYTSTGNIMLVTYFSNYASAHELSLSYSTVNSACGGDFSMLAANLATPGYPGTYPTNVECVWTLQAAPGNVLRLTWKEFFLTESAFCSSDYVEVRKGSASAELIGTFCGAGAPNNITSSTGLWIKFFSGKGAPPEGVSTRFFAEVSHLETVELTGTWGEIANPLYPRSIINAPYDGGFRWRITVATGKKIRLTFLDLFTDHCEYSEPISIFDGYDDTAPKKTFCGVLPKDVMVSSSNVAFVILPQGYDDVGIRFKLKWEEVATPAVVSVVNATSDCGGEFSLSQRMQSMIISSPGYPLRYPPYKKCTWKIRAPPGFHLAYQVTDMQIYSSPNCVFDSVAAYDGEDSRAKQVGLYCRRNDTFPRFPVEVGPVLTIVFQSSFMGSRAGFSMTVDMDHGGLIEGSIGSIDFNWNSTVWRAWIQLKQYHEWVVHVGRGRRVELWFDQFNVPALPDGTCGDKYVLLRNGHHADSPILGKGRYCGSKPAKMITSSEYLFVRAYIPFRTHTFKLQFREMMEACGGRLVLPDDPKSFLTINSPSYPNSPPPKIECVWIVLAPAGKTMQLDFIGRFDFKQTANCAGEYVEVRDGGSMLAESLGRFCGNPPSTLKSSDFMFYIKYFTDVNEPNNGFSAKISLERCGGVIRGSNGVIRSPGYPVLGPNLDCLWTIETQDYRQIMLSTVDFDMPPGITQPPSTTSLADYRKFLWARRNSNCSLVDSVLVYEVTPPLPDEDNEMNARLKYLLDRPTYLSLRQQRQFATSDKMLAVGCSSNPLGVVTASGNKVSVRLITSATLSGKTLRGFTLNFTSVKTQCGGDLTTPDGFITSPYYPREMPRPYYCRWVITAPLGRRVTLNVLDFDLSGNRMDQRIYVYENAMRGPTKIYDRGSPPPSQLNSTSNSVVLAYHTTGFSGPPHKGFRISYSTDAPAPCGGELTATEGVLEPPQNLTWFACMWSLPLLRSGSYVFTLSNSRLSNVTVDCEHVSVGLYIYSRQHDFYKIFCGETPGQTFATPTSKLQVSALWNSRFSPMVFSLGYRTSDCGGIVNASALPYTLTSPNYPHFYPANSHCAWKIAALEGETLKVTFDRFDLGDNAAGNYLAIYNGPSSNAPLIGKYTGSKDSSSSVVSQGDALFIEFHTLDKPGAGFQITIDNNHTVCGGVVSSSGVTIKTPSYPSKYDPNMECEWELQSVPGSHIGLVFTNRFYIEQSPDCANDSLSLYDFKDGDWKLIQSLCGRVPPPMVNSSSSRMLVKFRSNDVIEGDGFSARWEKNCGGELVDSSGVVMSPNFPDNYPDDLNCVYYIRGFGQVIHLKFTSFALEAGFKQCKFDYVEIEDVGDINAKTYGRYCGTTGPPEITSHKDLKVTFVSDRFSRASGFAFEYSVERCGGNITQSSLVSYVSGQSAPPGDCLWKITAPANMIVSLQIMNISVGRDPTCAMMYLAAVDSDNTTLAQICGNPNTTIPFVSSGNTMQLLLAKKYRYYPVSYFTAYVVFSYGPKQGCGGNLEIKDNPETVSSPDVNRDGLYEEFLDCHWNIEAREGYYVTAKVLNLDIDRCNRTDCPCDFLEFRDGVGPHDDLILRTCGTTLPELVVGSSNKMFMRFATDGSYSGRGFTVQFSSVRSLCGQRSLTATHAVQKLTSPGYPSNYPTGARCVWFISALNETSKPLFMRSSIHLWVKKWALEDSQDCDKDYLSLEDYGNRLVSAKESQDRDIGSGGLVVHGRGSLPRSLSYAKRMLIGKTRYCGEGSHFDFYSSTGSAVVEFVSNAALTNHGFELEYSLSPCNRNYTASQGRIRHSKFQPNELCTIEIHAPYPNNTISLYFSSFSMPNDCEKTYFLVKDGPLSTSNQLLRACGYLKPKPVYSTGPQLYITMFTSVPTYTDIDMTYTTTDRGIGCGGELYNFGGLFTSPNYPDNVRTAAVCEWTVSVPEGLDLVMEFTDFNMGPKSTCTTDFIEFKELNEDTNERVLLTRFCGEDRPSLVVSQTGIIIVKYTRSVHNGGSGWSLSFAGVTPGTKIIAN